jgi:hypothetical protein
MNFQDHSSSASHALYLLLFEENNEANLSTLSTQEITTCVTLLQASTHSDAFLKLLKLINIFDQTDPLEAIGKGLSLQQFLMLIVHFSHHPEGKTKLSPLFVGLSPSIFFQALFEISSDHLLVLKQESISEPLQSQLTFFEHDCERFFEKMNEEFIHLQQEIEKVDKKTFSYQNLKTLEKRIEEIRCACEERLTGLNKALAITWNTNRIDLIDKLSKLKENFIHLITQQIGFPMLDHTPTGLYLILRQTLSTVFNATKNQQQQESLADGDSALEGLTKFSIWYLKDYWNLGLLPEILDPAELEWDPLKHTDQERIEHHHYLFSLIQSHLNKLQIGTVGDLKKAHIYSRNMLEEYISQRTHFLKAKSSS